MTLPTRSGQLLVLLTVCFMLPAGCAVRLPGTASLPPDARQEVLSSLAEFVNRDCPDTLDADVTIELQLLGSREKASGTVQLMEPSSLRYSATDPLGRPLFIMATDGRIFTVVDNRSAEAVTGPVESPMLHEYIPGYIEPENVFAWLTGRMPQPVLPVTEVRAETEGDGVWLFTGGTGGDRHLLRFDPQAEVITRHLLQDEDGDTLLDVSYSGYRPGQLCPVPALITAEGEDFRGTVFIRYDRLYTDSRLNPDQFSLTIPPHFTLRKIE